MPESLFARGQYSLDWVKDFYTQTGVWWGPDVQDPRAHQARLDALQRLCGPAPKRVLELGCGPGRTAALMADAGYDVTGVELNQTDAAAARALLDTPRKGALDFIEGDFYSVALPGRFDAVCCWECFGLGSDADQRRLLHRIALEWLAPGGCVLMDVYSPYAPTRAAGSEVRLPPLKGVPGSVEMFNCSHYDPVHARWIDEWVPVVHPEQALAQTIRCYSPVDFLLLLEGTGLALRRIEVVGGERDGAGGEALDFAGEKITLTGPMTTAYSYMVQMEGEG